MYRECNKSDWEKGFKYQAWAGYEWVNVEVGKNGYNKEDFMMLVNAGGISRIRVKIIDNNKK